MGRIVVPVHIPGREILCDALVDTGAGGLVLPTAWRDRLSPFAKSRPVKLETANQRISEGEVCGPVEVQIEGFDAVFNEVTFVDSEPQSGAYERLLGYILLEQSRAAVDPVGHRLVPLKAFDLKAFSWRDSGTLSRRPLADGARSLLLSRRARRSIAHACEAKADRPATTCLARRSRRRRRVIVCYESWR
jgi:hypothetical protein